MSKNFPAMTPPLVNKLNFNGTTNYGDNLLIDTYIELEDT